MQNLILASSSPRRKELLENLQLSFITVSSDVDESYDPNWNPHQIVMELSHERRRLFFKLSHLFCDWIGHDRRK